MNNPNSSRATQWKKQARQCLALFSGFFLFSAAGCSTLPNNTAPEVIATFAPQADPQVEIMSPKQGADADLVLREFYKASGKPANDYQSTRNFLTPDAQEQWTPKEAVDVVDSIDILTTDNGLDHKTFEVSGKHIGTLSPNGAYTPSGRDYSATVQMQKVDGQWRIQDFPPKLVIERNDLRNNYRPISLYFLGQSGESLVSDRRWIYTGQQSIDSEIVTLLLEGPNTDLRPATTDLTPTSATFLGYENGTYNFGGLSSMSKDERFRFAAALTWTLNNAGVSTTVKATADGSPLVDGLDVMTVDDFAEFNPGNLVSSDTQLFAVNNGALFEVAGDQVEPANSVLGRGSDVQSADISKEGIVAAIRKKSSDEYQLSMGELGVKLEDDLKAKTLARPTFEANGQSIWTVVDGKKVVRVSRSAKGELHQSEIDASSLDSIQGEISVIRLSATGARVAMIIEGNVYVGVVVRGKNRKYSIVNAHRVSQEIQNTALSLDWMSDGGLMVGTDSVNSPVWRIEQDGSSATTLATGNVTAPVVAVAASPTKLYITDSHALLELPAESTDNTFWREVAGLQGQRSSPIVAK